MKSTVGVEEFEDPELQTMHAEVARLSELVAKKDATYTQVERLTHLRNLLRRKAQRKDR